MARPNIPLALLLLVIVAIAVVTLFPGTAQGPSFAASLWFRLLGALVLAATVAGLARSASHKRISSLLAHFGLLLILLGAGLETQGREILASLSEGEDISSYQISGREYPLGFNLALCRALDQASLVRINHGPEQTVAPSRPIHTRGWLLLQEGCEQVATTKCLVLAGPDAETIIAAPGQRVDLPGSGHAVIFDQEVFTAPDTLFPFRVFERDREKARATLSRQGIFPPTIKLGLALIRFELDYDGVSHFRLVRRPGAVFAFLGFALVLIALATGTVATASPLKPHPQDQGAAPCRPSWPVFLPLVGLVAFALLSVLIQGRSPVGLELRLAWLAATLYLLALGICTVSLWQSRRGFRSGGYVLFGLGLAAHFLAFLLRWSLSGHLPLASKFEALLGASLATSAVSYLLVTRRHDLSVALISLPFALALLILGLANPGTGIQPLPKVLDSPLFAVHVILALVGYAVLIVNAALALRGLLASLAKGRLKASMPSGKDTQVCPYLVLARRLVPWGLLLLGAGLASGSVWALLAWGNWWSWDPKENAALVTWLSYLAYCHSGRWKREPGPGDAIYLISALVLVALTFLGVNLLRRGLHVY
ncbi:MAG: cytochrome c biogenesis protein CcsA [candidate division WOR-3 bacterium]